MDDYDHNSNIVDPHRNDFLAVDHTQDWIKAATAAILLISAIAAIISHNADDEKWEE